MGISRVEPIEISRAHLSIYNSSMVKQITARVVVGGELLSNILTHPEMSNF